METFTTKIADVKSLNIFKEMIKEYNLSPKTKLEVGEILVIEFESPDLHKKFVDDAISRGIRFGFNPPNK